MTVGLGLFLHIPKYFFWQVAVGYSDCLHLWKQMFLCVTVYEGFVMEFRSHVAPSFISAVLFLFACCSRKYASLPSQSQFTEWKLSISVVWAAASVQINLLVGRWRFQRFHCFLKICRLLMLTLSLACFSVTFFPAIFFHLLELTCG